MTAETHSQNGIKMENRNWSMNNMDVQVLSLFQDSFLTIKDVSTALSISYDAAKRCLHRLKNEDKIECIYRGIYCLKGNVEKNSFLPCSIRVCKGFKFNIPCRVVSQLGLRELDKKPLRITLRKPNKEYAFITKASYCPKSHQTNSFIPLDVRKNLCLKQSDSLEIVDIHRANQFIPSSRMFVGNKIDLLFFIPKQSRKGFSLFVEEINKNKENFLIIKYPTNSGSSTQVSIKRFVDPIEFGSILGQLQAEGTKFTNLPSNQSPRLIFTNKPIEEHRQFIGFLENMGIEKTLLKANCHYNPLNYPEEKVKNRINVFKAITGITPRCYSYPDKEKLYYCFWVLVERAVLAEIFLHSLDKAREVITRQTCLEGRLKDFAEAFLAKTLTGDGSISFTKNKKGHVRVQGYISDKNIEYREDYRKILKLFNVAVANWDDGQRVYFRCSEKTLCFFVRISAFKGTRSWKKLLRGIILKQETGGNYKRFKEIQKQGTVTHKEFAAVFGVKIEAAKHWLRDKRKRDYLSLKSTPNREYAYLLSRKAQELLHFIDSCKNELECEHNVIRCPEKSFRAPTL